MTRGAKFHPCILVKSSSPPSLAQSSVRKQLWGNKVTKVARTIKGDRFHWLNKQLKFVQISLRCVLNSPAYGIRNSQIAFVLRIAIEVEMDL